MYVCFARGRSNTQSIDNILVRDKKFHLAEKIFKAVKTSTCQVHRR